MTASNPPKSFTYRDAGVDMDAGDSLVEALKPIAARTFRPGVLAGLGGFGALFQLSNHYREPVLVSGTDGVGTKLLLAIAHDSHDDIGIDLVAMCANDVVVQGAEPLFFLDYFASGHLDTARATRIIAGIGRGCELAGAALVGGETAEMPGLYATDDYDLAGFCVGVVERDQLIDGQKVKAGDQLIGLRSSGAHSNGFSLIRRVIKHQNTDLSQDFNGAPLIEALLSPTRIYVKTLLALRKHVDIHAMAHITGGGLPGNVPRVLPNGLGVVIDQTAWEWPALFHWLQAGGNISNEEMYRTFNCGVGMVIIVAPEDQEKAVHFLRTSGEDPINLGVVEASACEFRLK